MPRAAWEFKIGGFQVLTKWLSYRQYDPAHPQDLLDRPLRPDEAREFSSLAQRLTTVVLMQLELDANYLAASAEPYSWPTNKSNIE